MRYLRFLRSTRSSAFSEKDHGADVDLAEMCDGGLKFFGGIVKQKVERTRLQTPIG